MMTPQSTHDFGRQLRVALENLRHPDVSVEYDVPLSKKTTFGIGGPADAWVSVRTPEAMVDTVAFVKRHELPWRVFGGGSNVLVGDRGVRGVLLTLSGELSEISLGDGIVLAGAGARFPKLTRTCIGEGMSSAVGWMGTPGQVGGALIMNAGTRDGELGDVVEQVLVLREGELLWLDHDACHFGYRSSGFRSDDVILKCRLKDLSADKSQADVYLEQAKMLLKKRHATQPKHRSAGSIFKNPPGDYAGRLIEAVGLKGRIHGRAQISDVHANFIVNLGGATAADVIALATEVQEKVYSGFSIQLQWEVRRIGEFT